MRILVHSDITRWNGFEERLYQERPDLLILAGDLVWDGFVAVDRELLGRIPSFEEKHEGIVGKYEGRLTAVQRRILSAREPAYHLRRVWLGEEYRSDLRTLENEYRDTPEYHRLRKEFHVDKFYQILQSASRICQAVLVVKGNHDDDFQGDYDVSRINEAGNCHEISGRVIEYQNFTFLGLGYPETHYIRKLREFSIGPKPDFIVTHSEDKRIKDLVAMGPRIIFRGHFGGTSMVGNALLVCPNSTPLLVELTPLEGNPKRLFARTKFFAKEYSSFAVCRNCGWVGSKTHSDTCFLRNGVIV